MTDKVRSEKMEVRSFISCVRKFKSCKHGACHMPKVLTKLFTSHSSLLTALLLLTSHFSLLTSSCSDSRSDLERAQEGAMVAAQVYYRQLAEGRCDQFLAAKMGADSLPQGYREQLVACYKQFVAQQRRAHKGIADVTATRAEMDSAANEMQVFLMLNYGDSTREEIVVPMVARRGAWLMK